MKYFIFCFSVLISFVCIWMAIRIIWLYIRTGGWMKVQANLVSKSIKLKPGNLHPGKSNYIPDIKYTYTVNGIMYDGVTIYMENLLGGNRSFKKDSVQKIVDAVPSDPFVWVNPKQPAEVVMFRHGIFIYVLTLGFGVLSFIVGLVFLLG